MSIIDIHEYKVEDSLLTFGGSSLEIGMRSMALTNELLARGMRHIAVEPDPRVFFPPMERFSLYNEAVVGDDNLKEVELVITSNVLCSHLNDSPFRFNQDGQELSRLKVRATTIGDLMKRQKIEQFDLIAMDCEGSEECILMSMREPVAKQISVEFHVHVGQSGEAVERMISHLESLGYKMACRYEVSGVEYGLFVLVPEKRFVGRERLSDLCMVTGFTPAGEWGNIGRVTVPSMMGYCEKWGHSLRVYLGGFDKSRHPSWSKLLFIRDTLAKYEWVWWLDADAAVTNYGIDVWRFVESGELVVCRDVPECIFNMGSFLIRRGEFSHWLFGELWKKSEWSNRPLWEQTALGEIFKEGKLDDKIVIYPMRSFNGFLDWKSGMFGKRVEEDLQWHVGDFVAHCSGYSMVDRLWILKEAIALSHDFCRQ